MGMGLRPTRRNPLGARASPPAWCAGVPARPQCVAPPWVRGRPARPQRRTPLGARASRNTPQCTERKLRNPLGARASPPAYSAAPHHRLTEGGFWGSPCVPSSVSGIRMSNLPLLPVWEKGAGGMRGKRRGNAAHRASRPRTPPLRAITGAPGCAGVPRMVRGRPRPQQRCAPSQAYRGRFLGKPLRAIFRFRHQDAQPPPSPRVGEGGRGDEGQKARECSTPRIAPKNATLESHHRSAGVPARPQRRTPVGARASRPHGARASPSAATLRSITGLQRRGFWGSPCVPSSVSGIRTPNLPLLPVWEKGAGGMRGKRRGNAAHRASRSRTPPLRAITGARARRHTRSRSAWVRGRPARMVRGRGAIPVPSERATTHRSAQDARR
jgi:hypothetical protein